MWGILISMLSGALMSIQGVFNTGVTEKTSVWVAAGWVQLTAFLACVVAWFVTGRPSVGAITGVHPRYLLLGGTPDRGGAAGGRLPDRTVRLVWIRQGGIPAP